MRKLVVSVSFCGTHEKAGEFPLDGRDHTRMLEAAIDAWTETGHYPAFVSATAFNPMEIRDEEERGLAWGIAVRYPVLSMLSNPGHQNGAAWIIRQSLEYAEAMGAEYLLHCAEDVLPLQSDQTSRWLCQIEETGVDYLGSPWGSTEELNTQVFVCRVKSFCDFANRRFVLDPVEFAGQCCVLESYLCRQVASFGLAVHLGAGQHGSGYWHTHDTTAFLDRAKLLSCQSHHSDPRCQDTKSAY